MRDVDQGAPSTTADVSAEMPASELRAVLDVVRALRDENDWDAVLEIVSKLVAENAAMSRRLAYRAPHRLRLRSTGR
ncbi:MAG: hypothetical protein AB7T06_29645 [Kofleriaceae bacterium]